MPLYEFECTHCGLRFERILQRFSDPLPEVCLECGGVLKKLFSAPAFQFKGSGWYATDYARKSGTPSSESEGGKSEGGESEGGESERGQSERGKSERGKSEGGESEKPKSETAKAESKTAEAKATTASAKSE